MKLDTSQIERYHNYLLDYGILNEDFEITDHLVCEIFFKYVYPHTKIKYISRTENQFNRYVTKQLNFTRLSLLNLKFYLNGNKSKGIKEGFVYAITNPSFPGFTKIGSSINVFNRLNSYQTYSPNRNFELKSYFFSYNRFLDEKDLISIHECKNEWICVPYEKIKDKFLEKRNISKNLNFRKYIKLDR